MRPRAIRSAFVLFGIVLISVIFQMRHQATQIAQLKNQLAAGEAAHTVAPRSGSIGAILPGHFISPGNATEAPAAANDVGTVIPSPALKNREIGTAELRERYEATFARDKQDTEWALRAKNILEAKLPSLLPAGSSVRSFECRASICRLETAHQNLDSYTQFIHVAFLGSSRQLWNSATYSTPLNGDPKDGLLVTYISREGQPLPEVE